MYCSRSCSCAKAQNEDAHADANGLFWDHAGGAVIYGRRDACGSC